jgi:hypothetical protein
MQPLNWLIRTIAPSKATIPLRMIFPFQFSYDWNVILNTNLRRLVAYVMNAG